MPSYKVKSPIKFGGERIESGTVEMSAKAAAPLVADGVLELEPAKAAGSGTSGDGGKDAGGKNAGGNKSDGDSANKGEGKK